MGPLPRRALAAAAAVAVLAAGGGWLFLASRDAPPSARLRPGAGGDGRPDGRWVVAQDAHGFVGYRVRERLGSISAPNDVVGRSPAVGGAVTIAGGAVTGAEVTVDMTRLRTDVEPRDGRMRDRAWRRHASRRPASACASRSHSATSPAPGWSSCGSRAT